MLKSISNFIIGFAVFFIVYSFMNINAISTSEFYINITLAISFICTNIFNVINFNRKGMIILNTIASICLLIAIILWLLS
ncbi:MAG: hypothetical protein H6Q70_2182 [Firmicutes bacterium]|nr:hypothetical protein [Bacillota bacterium]